MGSRYAELGCRLTSLSASPDGRHATVGIQNGLKVVAVSTDGSSVNCALELRMARQKGSKTNDLHWNPQPTASVVASAGSDGTIALWDLDSGKDLLASWTAHPRAINCLRWSPSEPNVLLSSAQDGALHLWDIRTPRTASLENLERPVIWRSSGHSAVRNLAWNPHGTGGVTSEFVTVVDAGALVQWDLRIANGRRPTPRNVIGGAHHGVALTVDWHPTAPRTVATGGRDKKIRVWDLDGLGPTAQNSNAESHCLTTIGTLAGVSHVRWRPAARQPLNGRDTGNNHLASVSLSTDTRILVWDCSEPDFPSVSFRDAQENQIVGMSWVPNGEYLWTASNNGRVHRSKLCDGDRVVDGLPSANVDVNVYNNIASSNGAFDRPTDEARRVLFQQRAQDNREPTYTGSLLVRPRADLVRSMAENYTLGGNPHVDPFNHNAVVAESFSCPDIAQMWRSLGSMWEIELGAVKLGVPDWPGGPVSPCRGYTLDLISVFAEAGDIQNASVIASVMTSRGMSDLGELEVVQRCSHLYIDILQRMRLFIRATETMRASPVDNIRLSNRLSTTIFTKRIGRRPTQDAFPNRMDPVMTCPVCSQPIKTLFSWCQGCGHGGHALCLQDWHVKTRTTSCPQSGCTHVCVE